MICHWWSFPQETAVIGGSFRAVLSGFHTPIGETGVLHALESETTKSHRVTNCIPFCSSVLSTRKTGPQGQRPNSNRTGGEAGKLRAGAGRSAPGADRYCTASHSLCERFIGTSVSSCSHCTDLYGKVCATAVRSSSSNSSQQQFGSAISIAVYFT
eukprot:scaffold54983_cov65-Phaeocystis_antarctica.AAC.1